MPALESFYNGGTNPDTFKAECEPGEARETGPYHVLKIGPVTHFVSADQLRQIRDAINGQLVTACCDLCGGAIGEGQQTADTCLCLECIRKAEAGPWTPAEIMQHAG